MHAWAADRMQATMISNAAVLCLLLFSAGHLAAASKSFGGGGGGYGEEAAGGQQEVPDVVLPQLPPLLNPVAMPVNNDYKAPEKAWSYTFGPGVEDDESPATPAKSSSKSPVSNNYKAPEKVPSKSSTPATPSKNKGYSSGTPSSSTTPATTPSKSSSPSSSSTPSTGGVKASYAAGGASSSTKGKSTMTPVSTGSGKAADSSSASSQGAAAGGGAGGYGGLDPDGEPEYGLNQKAIDDILKEHNAFRAKEHVPPLSWNATLAKFSQQYAEKTLKGPCQMVHSTSPYGENLMLGTGAITWKTTVDQWEDEKKSYHYGSNSCDAGKMCGHYTAVVWKGTTSVGCGRVKCDNGDTMIMCSYWPPGNYDGERPY